MQVIIFNETDGSLMYSTDDFGLDQENWQLSIKMISIRSDESIIDPQYLFSITFQDSCWDRIINPIMFNDQELTYDLWQSELLSFSHDSDPLPTETDLCGGFTYELVYKSGPAFDLTLP